MKKFKFSLLPLLKTRRVFKKQKEAEFALSCAELERLLSEKKRLEDELEARGAEYALAVARTMTARRLLWYSNYFEYMRQEIAGMAPTVKAAEEKKEALRNELVALVREVETLEKLEREQYRDYLREAAKDEEKVLGDLMNYDSASAKEAL